MLEWQGRSATIRSGWIIEHGSDQLLKTRIFSSSSATRSSTGAAQFGYYTGSGDRFNGTSAATPNVTGVASLVWSANPYLSATQVQLILSQTTYDLGVSGYDIEYGSGFVNADAAVRRALALARGVA